MKSEVKDEVKGEVMSDVSRRWKSGDIGPLEILEVICLKCG